jgi:hypothetical protein
MGFTGPGINAQEESIFDVSCYQISVPSVLTLYEKLG